MLIAFCVEPIRFDSNISDHIVGAMRTTASFFTHEGINRSPITLVDCFYMWFVVSDLISDLNGEMSRTQITILTR